MSKQNQKEAVYSAIESVLAESGQTINESTPVSSMLTSAARQQVMNILVEGFNSESIELESKFETPSKLRAYVSGLVSNWLRKDKRLNGGVKYTPANPGSRSHHSDPQIKAMKALIASGTVTDPADLNEIYEAIRLRQAELLPKQEVTVDYSALPESLRNKFVSA